MSDQDRSQMDENKMLFGQLVMTLATSALQGMGKIVNPMTRKTETNLDAAQAAIDMLDMIEARTKGNLDNEEARFLKTTLADLKINYIETANKAPKAEAAEKPSEVIGGSAADASAEDKVRFHKKYE